MRSVKRLSGPNAYVKLDIDHGRRIPSDTVLARKLERAGYAIRRINRYRSRSRTGWHVVIELDPEPTHPFEVVALQAILGSDPSREACNLHRAKKLIEGVPAFMIDSWNVLYKGERR